MKVDPNTGNVVCSIQLPATSPTNMAFGECPNKEDGQLNCLYVTTLRQGLTSPTSDDGGLFLIEGTGSEGVLPYRVEYDQVFNTKSGSCTRPT